MVDSFVTYYEENEQSKIAKVYGVYTITTKVFANLDFMIVENITKTNNPNNFKVTFDLKGATFKRETKLAS